MSFIETTLALRVLGSAKHREDYDLVNKRYLAYFGVIRNMQKENRKYNVNLFNQVNEGYSEYLLAMNNIEGIGELEELLEEGNDESEGNPGEKK